MEPRRLPLVNEEMAAAVNDTRDRTRARVAESLKALPSRPPFAFAAMLTDMLYEARAKHHAACQVRCAHCCKTHVDATAVEVIALARWLRNAMPGPVLDKVIARLGSATVQTSGLDLGDRLRAQIPCPLLAEGTNKCRGYNARPLACRSWHSLDVEDCRRGGTVHVTDSLDLMRAVSGGLSDGVEEAGYDARLLPLIPALWTALTDPEFERAWFAKEQVALRGLDVTSGARLDTEGEQARPGE